MAVLDRVHAPLDLGDAEHGILDVERQGEHDEAEAVAELLRQRLVERTQVERDEGVDLVGARALCVGVVGDGARHGGDEHVVDRRAERLRGALDAPQRDRLRPGDAVRGVLLAADGAAGVPGGQQQLAEGLHVADGVAQGRARMLRGACEHPGEPRRAAEPRAAVRADIREAALVSRVLVVGQRQHHLREGDAVRDRVVHAHEHRAAGAVAVDQADLPQRARPVERASRPGRRRAPAARCRSPGAGSASRWKCRSGSKSATSSQLPPAGRWRKRSKRSTMRSRKTARQRSQSIGSPNHITLLITIRLVGRSMCSQAASALPMAWRVLMGRPYGGGEPQPSG